LAICLSAFDAGYSLLLSFLRTSTLVLFGFHVSASQTCWVNSVQSSFLTKLTHSINVPLVIHGWYTVNGRCSIRKGMDGAHDHAWRRQRPPSPQQCIDIGCNLWCKTTPRLLTPPVDIIRTRGCGVFTGAVLRGTGTARSQLTRDVTHVVA
jgi:hypothetical protein